jgi:bifunctional non-homologous end joining protein LigD
MTEQVMLGIDGDYPDMKKQGFVAQPKWDGQRAKIIYAKSGFIRIINRRGFCWNRSLPEIVAAAQQLGTKLGGEDYTLDGEIVVIKNGHCDLSSSATRVLSTDANVIKFQLMRTCPVTFKVFDIMCLGHERLERKPLSERLTILDDMIRSFPLHMELTPTYFDAEECWQIWVDENEEEGVMLKYENGFYVYERSPSWIKVKRRESVEFNVIGYTEGEGKRSSVFGALILADDQGKLRGRCGTGFSEAQAKEIMEALKTTPFTAKPFSEAEVGKSYRAVEAKMRVLVMYQKEEASGKLRSPRLARWWWR